MKKLIYLLPITILLTGLTNKTFAYNYYTDDGATYSNQQFQRDVKSYLDVQMERQENQDLINTINQGYSSIKTQFDINQMQQKLDEAKKDYENTSEQIKQLQDVVSQQNQILLEQKKQKEDDQKEYDYKHGICKEVESRYGGVVEIQSLADNCAKYGVYLKVHKETDTPTLNTPTVKKVPRPAFLEEPNILDEPSVPVATSTSTSTVTNSPEVKSTSFIKRTFQKVIHLFSWW